MHDLIQLYYRSIHKDRAKDLILKITDKLPDLNILKALVTFDDTTFELTTSLLMDVLDQTTFDDPTAIALVRFITDTHSNHGKHASTAMQFVEYLVSREFPDITVQSIGLAVHLPYHVTRYTFHRVLPASETVRMLRLLFDAGYNSPSNLLDFPDWRLNGVGPNQNYLNSDVVAFFKDWVSKYNLPVTEEMLNIFHEKNTSPFPNTPEKQEIYDILNFAYKLNTDTLLFQDIGGAIDESFQNNLSTDLT